MKSIAIVLMLLASIPAYASTASANHGHHGGGNNGAVGAAASAFGGSASSSGAAAGSSGGNGGSYGDWYLRTDPVDAYQPWPQSEMARFQKP